MTVEPSAVWRFTRAEISVAIRWPEPPELPHEPNFPNTWGDFEQSKQGHETKLFDFLAIAVRLVRKSKSFSEW